MHFFSKNNSFQNLERKKKREPYIKRHYLLLWKMEYLNVCHLRPKFMMKTRYSGD